MAVGKKIGSNLKQGAQRLTQNSKQRKYEEYTYL
jgi:hypothetical protein